MARHFGKTYKGINQKNNNKYHSHSEGVEDLLPDISYILLYRGQVGFQHFSLDMVVSKYQIFFLAKRITISHTCLETLNLFQDYKQQTRVQDVIIKL